MEQDILIEDDRFSVVHRGTPDQFRTVISARSAHEAKEKQRDRRVIVVLESDEGESYFMFGNPNGYDRIILDPDTILEMASQIETHRLMKSMQVLAEKDQKIADCLQSMVEPFPHRATA